MLTTKKNILLVDDDAIAIFLIEKIIASAGIAKEVYKALNGQEALQVLKANEARTALPDLILLDLNMPVMDGFEFIEAFHNLDLASKEKILIIIVTSSNNPSDIEKAKSLGIKYYLTKPLTAESIKSILQDGNS